MAPPSLRYRSDIFPEGHRKKSDGDNVNVRNVAGGGVEIMRHNTMITNGADSGVTVSCFCNLKIV